ncbi:MAG TPA: hypothetical protein VFT84_09650 [Gemmatimonadales bacterium]|nr:hypothetical protein [Gemmatimonadales bacterium]
MASSSKKRTTMAKINREHALREQRIRKAARMEARRLEAAAPPPEPAPDGDREGPPEAPDG